MPEAPEKLDLKSLNLSEEKRQELLSLVLRLPKTLIMFINIQRKGI